ncbi:MAG: Fur family transcriptional regulator [Vulcanimicrobiota bacterium]
MIRSTRQRSAIREAIKAAGRPLCTDEILQLARQEVPNLGIATVYRAVKALLDERWLHAVELPGQTTLYERAGLGHHHHFHCRQCGKVYDIDGCPGNLGRLVPEGFQLEDHDLTLYGRCDAC